MNRTSQSTVTGFILMLLISAGSVQGQVTTATIYGAVTDANGAPIAGASIKATNAATAAVFNATTQGEGEFTFTLLPVGRYSLSISATGFKEQVQENIDLSAGQRLRLSYLLAVGQVTEKITITSETPTIQNVSPEQLVTHSTLQVRELPLARRDWTNLINIGPGLQVRGAGGGTGVVMNGLAPGAVGLTVDGTLASGSAEENSLTAFGNFNLIRVVSLEAISEVNVSQGIASAEFANTLSGNVGLITKSGGNEFHGSVFENFQGRVLNARNQFLATRPPEVFNQFGGSFGGPVIRNKLFFFGVYEGYRLRRFATFNTDVPTKEFRDQSIAAVPAYKEFFDTLPLPNQPVAPGAITARFIGFDSSQGNDDHIVARGDYNITDQSRVSGRYTRGRPDSLTPRASPANPRTFDSQDDTVTASFIQSSSRISLETRFGYKRNSVERLDGIYALGVPGISGLGFSNGGEILLSKGRGWSIEQNAAVTTGRHSIKFGGFFQFQNQTRSNIETPAIQYADVTDFLANIPSRIQVTFGLNPYLISYWNNGYFIQDDFRITPRLVVNLGLRYDYFSVPVEENDRFFNRNAPFGFGSLRSPESIYQADRNNFAPRLGFAWTVDSSSKTVVRGGVGSFYTRSPLRNILELVRNALDEPFRVVFSRSEGIARGLKYPITNAATLPLVKSPNFDWTGTTINPDFPTPYSLQWTLSLQRQLTNSMAVEAAYVGNRGVKLLFNRQANTVDRLTGVRPVTGFGEFRHFDTSESSHYHGLQLSVRQRLSRSFLFNTHYTWSSNISYTSGDLTTLSAPQDPNNLRLEKGPTPYAVRHRFVTDLLYELPFARWAGSSGQGGRLLFDGWQLSGIFSAETGSPFSVETPSSIIGQRADLIGDPYLKDSSRPLQYLNPLALARVPVVTASGASSRPGTLGRNALYGPGYWNIDLALAKNLEFTERWRMQIRADMFNAFNHTSFSDINMNITNTSFGLFTSTRGARTIQLNARLTF
jgi:Carboxypeptidase regulatory-like domain/TonB dependent receptor